MELMSIGKFAKRIGVNTMTLRRMEATGELHPAHVSAGGTRYYSTEQLKLFIKTPNKHKLVVGYCRVSTPSQNESKRRFRDSSKQCEILYDCKGLSI